MSAFTDAAVAALKRIAPYVIGAIVILGGILTVIAKLKGQ